jgi:glycosyltransferase involved in cell wall biosynthesis
MDREPGTSPTSPVKLAACGWESPLNPKFGSRAPLNMCEELKRRGRLGPVIHVVPLPQPTQHAQPATPATPPPPGPARVTTRDRVAGALKGLAAPLRYPLYWSRVRRMDRLLRAAGDNARHVLHFYGELYLPLPRKPSGTRHYLMLDSPFEERIERGHLPPGFFRYMDRRMRDAYHQMDHLFPLSEYTRDRLVGRYGVPPERVTVIGSGRGVVEPYHGPKDYGNKTILYAVKAPFADKGGPLLLEAFKLARQRDPALKLWLVGAQGLDERERYTPGVTVYGFLPLGQLQDLFNRAALFAMPAPNEPWGLVFLEALSCKTPFVALNRRAVPELSGRGRYGFPVDEATPVAVANALLNATSDPECLRRMGEEGQAYCLSRYSWELAIDRILEQVDRIEREARN